MDDSQEKETNKPAENVEEWPIEVVAEEAEPIVGEAPKKVETVNTEKEVKPEGVEDKAEKTSEPEKKKKGINPALVIVLVLVGVTIIGIVVTIFMTGLIEALLSESGFLDGMDMSGQNNSMPTGGDFERYCKAYANYETEFADLTGDVDESSFYNGSYSCTIENAEWPVSMITFMELKDDFRNLEELGNILNNYEKGWSGKDAKFAIVDESENVLKGVMAYGYTWDNYRLDLFYDNLWVCIETIDLAAAEDVLKELGLPETKQSATNLSLGAEHQDRLAMKDLGNIRDLLKEYMGDNRGNLPVIETATTSGFESYIDGTGTSAWNKFYNDYFLKGDGNIEAPDGTKYQFRAFRSAQPDWAKDGEKMISVFYGSACRDGELDGGKKERRFALTYPKAGESGAYICVDNS